MRYERWRFIDSGALTGAENMAIDEAMLEAQGANESLPTLRVYTWRPVAVSLGKFQRVGSSVDLEACRQLGIHVVRRPTGGRAILHTDDEVTFSLVLSTTRLGVKGVMASYRALAGGIVAALRLLGADARLSERAPPSNRPRVSQDPACFAIRARCDIAVGCWKLVGSAQLQRKGVLLQQNSLPLRLHVAEWGKVLLRSPTPPEAIGLCDATAAEVTYSDVGDALRRGFEACFGISFEENGMTAREQARAAELMEHVRVL